MPKKKVGASSGYAAAEVEDFETRGQTLLGENRLAEALDCFSQAVIALPTRQQLWYHRGVAAAELLEDAADLEAPEASQLLKVALESFRRVLELDTSRRGEVRYLSALAAARLLTKVAERLEEDDQVGWPAKALPVLEEALKYFEETARLIRDWGHPDIGSTGWGDWGKALSVEMKRLIALHRETPAQTIAADHIEALSKACEAAVPKFQQASQVAPTREENEEAWEDDEADDDLHWMTLHVEHLLIFVNFASEILAGRLAHLDDGIRPELVRRAILAWRSAVRFSDARVELEGSAADWKALALKADTLAAGCELIGVLQLHPSSAAGMEGCAGQAQVERLCLPRAPVPTEPGSERMDLDTQEEQADELRLAAMAEALYGAALARGGEGSSGVVNLALGELALGLARRRLQASEVAPDQAKVENWLKVAVDAFKAVTASDAEDDEKAAAWYNMACAAALASKPEAAGKALRMCLRLTPPASKQRCREEAAADRDLSCVLFHPDVQMALRAS